MTKKIFRTICLVAISVAMLSFLLFMTVLYDYFSEVQREQLQSETELAAQGVAKIGIAYFDDLNIKNYRITQIAPDGSVVYDNFSKAADMDNHAMREEVAEAFATGSGESERYSATLTERYLYNAKKLPDGSVIRLAITQNSLLTLTLGMLHPVIFILVIAVILAIILASRLSKKIVMPLNSLNLDEPMENEGYDELAPLLRRIDSQQRKIVRQSNILQQRQKEFKTLTSAMTEGLVLISSNNSILSINSSAMKLLDTDETCIGKKMAEINRSMKLDKLLRGAASGIHTEEILELGHRLYQTLASPVFSGNAVSGVVLLFLDITEREQSEQLRREFTANVSHELKTPLHTIAGSAELMSGNMVRPEDISIFSKRIYEEAKHLISLVDDIIKLSRLDEGTKNMKWEGVDIYTLAKNVVNSLKAKAATVGVQIQLNRESASVYGIRQLIQGIIYNLCDNAIKYNHQGGEVIINIKKENAVAVLSVSDTGIGIAQEEQNRIFERFYRVEKSHSRSISGTGLGLSIVKHSAKLHNAEIAVSSEPGKGAEFIVKFPLYK